MSKTNKNLINNNNNTNNPLTKISAKPHLGIVIVGHVDAGKSTTTGRLLFELGNLSQRELDKLRKEAKELGNEASLFAIYLDQTKEEKSRGLTIQCCSREFFTKQYHYTIIDAPGHRTFIKNMISGASQADVALLMVPANKGGFETSIAKGNHRRKEMQGQTRQHARLCHLLGIEQIIVAINKMDDPSVQFSEDRYNEIKSEVEKMLTKIGYKTKKVPFIPISGFKGDNLTTKSKNMKWYKGFTVKMKKEKISGHTLVDALDLVCKPPKRNSKKPLRMPVSGIYKINGIGDVITGRIEQGQLNTGVMCKFLPTGCTAKVFSIEMHHKKVEKAECGDNIGVNIKTQTNNKNKSNSMPRVGDIMIIDDSKLDPNPPKSVSQFTALVFVQDHPGKLCSAKKINIKGNLKQKQKKKKKDGDKNKNTNKNVIQHETSSSSGYYYKGGFAPIVHIRTAKAPCQMISIKWKTGKTTNNQKLELPGYIEAGDQAEIVFAPKQPFVVEPFDICKPLGRIAVMDSNSLVMLGKVIKVEQKKI